VIPFHTLMRISTPRLESEPDTYPAPHPEQLRRLLHVLLLFSSLLGRIPPLLLTPAWLASAAIAAWPWSGLRLPVAALGVFGILVDGISLSLLSTYGRSYGPATPPLLALAVVRALLSLLMGLISPMPWMFLVLTLLQLLISAVVVYSTWIEPFRLTVTHHSLQNPMLRERGTVRLLHLSDLHVERITKRERELVQRVQELKPDVLVLTGDYLNISYTEDKQAQSDARNLLDQLCESVAGPVFAVTGSPLVDLASVIPKIFAGLPITWLMDESQCIVIKGERVRFSGLRCAGDRCRDALRLNHLLEAYAQACFTVLLYHTPDLMPEAVAAGVDLYLCGHTHGGQLRVPLFGALVTSSRFWKRYEMGRYEEGNTTLYVNRGLGMEGFGAPRARFLAPPEIAVWDISC